MSVAATLRELARLVEGCRGDVDGIEFPDGIDASDPRGTTARVALLVPASRGLSSRLDADGTLWLSPGALVPAGTDAEVTEIGLEGDAVRVILSVGTDGSPIDVAASDREEGESDGVEDGTPAKGAKVTPEDTESTDRRTGGECPADGDDDTSAPSAGESSRVPWRDREVPPFEDSELLAEVYDSCETFAEMTDALGMDVTAETVRRYMIDHGIHEPDSYDTGGTDVEEGDDAQTGSPATADAQTGSPATADVTGADAEPTTGEGGAEPVVDEEGPGPAVGAAPSEPASDPDAEPATADEPEPVVVADGIGLPEDVTVETFIETVRRSNTIREVRRDVGVEREDALELLRELNLLDLVVGRMAVEGERDISREEIVDRLREASAAH